MITGTPPKSPSCESVQQEARLTPIMLQCVRWNLAAEVVKRRTHPRRKVPKSPAAISQHKNLTGLPRVARDIAADIYNNIQKWNEQHIRGANLIKQILIVKLDNPGQYPRGLEELMIELFDTVEKLSVYANALVFLTSQMQALIKLQRTPAPLFVSLTIQQMAELTGAISDAYQAEYKEKQYILENIAHSKSHREVMYLATNWTHQKNVTNNINLKVETVLTETGHRKTT